MADYNLLTARQIRALEAGTVIALPASIDLVGDQFLTPIGGWPVDRADEEGADPVRALVMRFEVEQAVVLLNYATRLLRVLDGEPAVWAAVARDLGDHLFGLPVPPPPDSALELLFVVHHNRMVLLGGYGVHDTPDAIQAAVLAAVARRPDRLIW